MKAGNELTGHSGNDEITTPDWLYDALNRRFHFDYDAAASYENAKCVLYSAVDGTWHALCSDPVSKQDGLSFPWARRRVFVNPPYSRPLMGQFIEKAIAERNEAEIIVMLVKFDPSTENGRLLMDNFHLEFLPRIKYGGMSNAATFPSVVAIPKHNWRKG